MKRTANIFNKIMMSGTLLLILSSFPGPIMAQYYLGFEPDSGAEGEGCPDTIWEQVPPGRWACSDVDAIRGQRSLHHSFDNPDAGCDFIILTHDPLQAGDSVILSFRVRHGYPPSSVNNWQVALLADYSLGGAEGGSAGLEAMAGNGVSAGEGARAAEEIRITGGLVLGVNFSGSDDLLKLWSCEEGESRELCATSLNCQEEVGTASAPEFRLVLEGEGRIGIYLRSDPGTGIFERIGSCRVDSLPGGRHLIIRYEYSSARDRNLWLDEIRLDGNFFRDTIAPFITGVQVLDTRHLQISLSEPLTLEPLTMIRDSSIRLSGLSIGTIVPSNLFIERTDLVLEFAWEIPNREALRLMVSGLCDPEGNCLPDTMVHIWRNDAEWGDVVFNELMADPAPPVRLPEEEYIELYNRSDFPIDPEGWRLDVNDRSHVISAEILEPGSYAVISGITLPNDGATLALYSKQGALIHAVKYEPPWNGPEWKGDGGWSLESPDPDLVCIASALWAYSVDPSGGTPGKNNSNFATLADRDPPVFLWQGFGDSFPEGSGGAFRGGVGEGSGEGSGEESGQGSGKGSLGESGEESGNRTGMLELHYSEPVRLPRDAREKILIFPGNASPDSVATAMPLNDRLQLWFPGELFQQQTFTLVCPPLVDCSGNLSAKLELRSGMTNRPGPGTVLINEIMYHPQEGAPEFVELHNPGLAFYDLQEFAIDLVSEGTEAVSPLPLSDRSRLVAPGAYLVLTRSTQRLMDFYDLELSGRWVEMGNWNGMPNSGGTVLLTDRSGAVVDRAVYGDQMHMELLTDTRGVSLERISPERPGIDPANWHSAASIEGYSTPGRKNSQSMDLADSHRLLEIAPQVFSPDNDGFEDLLEISLFPGSPEWVIDLWVTDLHGARIRTLAGNHIAGPSAGYTWDGEDGAGSMVPGGIYVVHARGYNSVSGERWNRKKAVGLIYR